jgi:hypothetical protein
MTMRSIQARTKVRTRPHGRARILALVGAGLVVLAAPPAAVAQWLNYPTAGVPRTADGAPDLRAPAPRAAAGKPDLSGIWTATETLAECEAGACIEQMRLPLDAVNIGRTLSVLPAAGSSIEDVALAGGLPLQTWAADLVARRSAGFAKDDPHARCLPPNFPRAYALPQYKKIVQTPDLLLILHEFNASYRQIFTDGRPLPVDPNPTWNGYSSGRWEGDTLIVESIGFRDDLWLDLSGNPLTEAARVTEKFERIDYGNLQVEITVDDPRAYTRPWTVMLKQSIVLDTELLDEICLENEKSVQHMDPG